MWSNSQDNFDSRIFRHKENENIIFKFMLRSNFKKQICFL